MNDADDVVDRFMVNRQTRVAVFHEKRANLLHRRFLVDSDKIHARRQNIRHIEIVELDRGTDEIALVSVQPTFALSLVDNAHQLFFSDAIVAGRLEDLREQLLPHAEKEIQRRQHDNDHTQDRRRKHREALRKFLGHAFWRDFAEDQHHDRDHNRRDRGPVGHKDFREEQGGDRRRRDVDNVVADENAREQLVIILAHSQRPRSALVAVFRPGFHADRVERGERRLSGRKIRRAHHKDHHSNDHAYQTTVHK